MSAALKSQEALSGGRPVSSAGRARRRLRVVSSPAPLTAQPAPLRPEVQRRMPLWLRILIVGQRLSSVMAAVTVMTTLVAYALTANASRRLTAATTTLEALQEQHQHLSAANAIFKNYLAESMTQASSTGVTPQHVIFVEAAEVMTPAAGAAAQSSGAPQSLPLYFPKGY